MVKITIPSVVQQYCMRERPTLKYPTPHMGTSDITLQRDTLRVGCLLLAPGLQKKEQSLGRRWSFRGKKKTKKAPIREKEQKARNRKMVTITIHAAFGRKARHILAHNRFKAKPHNLASATVVCREVHTSRGRWMQRKMVPKVNAFRAICTKGSNGWQDQAKTFIVSKPVASQYPSQIKRQNQRQILVCQRIAYSCSPKD